MRKLSIALCGALLMVAAFVCFPSLRSAAANTACAIDQGGLNFNAGSGCSIIVKAAEQDEISLVYGRSDREAGVVDDRAIAVARDQKAATSDFGKGRLVARVQAAPGDLARRQHAVIGLRRQAECGKAPLVADGALAGIGEHDDALAGALQRRHAVACRRVDLAPVMQHAPLVEQHVIDAHPQPVPAELVS